jgi:copper transport protein
MSASGALAHAVLLTSTPADGSVLKAAPGTLALTFSEPVSPIAMRLVDADGAGSDLEQIRRQDATIVIATPPIKSGTHALSWRVISADGHPTGGSVVFSIGEPISGMIIETSTPLPVKVLLWSTRFLLYLGLFIGVGGRFFASWVSAGQLLPVIARRVAVVCLIAGLASVAASIGLQGLDVLGVDLGRLLDRGTWHAGLSTSYAKTLAVAATAQGLALLYGWIRGVAIGRVVTAVALLGVGTALAISGHASTAPPQFITRPAIFIHGVCIAFWIGSLFPLAALIFSGDTQSVPALARFSQAMPVPTALLAASGMLLAAIQLSRVSALWTTPYGLVFDAKIAAVIVLICLAAWNRFNLTGRVAAGDASAERALVRSIAWEMMLVAIILGLVTTSRFTQPPRASSQVATVVHPVRVHVRGERAMADLTLTPGRVGPTSAAIAILDGHFRQMDARGVTLTLISPSASIEPIKREARHLEGADWTVDALTIPAAGHWIGKVDILISDFEEVPLQEEFDMPL